MINLSNIVTNTPIVKKFIGYGDEAIYNTLILMIRIIKESARDYYIRRWAEYIVSGTEKDEYSRLQSLYNFLTDNVQYLKDMEGIEMLKKPQIALKELEQEITPQLDCDCMTVLAGSLARSIGFSVALRAIAPKGKNKYSHVYAMIKVKKHGWIPVDLTKPEFGLGWEYPSAGRVITLKVK
jgi:hypothetical protein